ncbi:hypothetical protein PR202_ga29974 [Eleusine coracana subsp. coracana]|uniref:NPH3 domain-containing protein n=1 Tax=Eleusine coracana subsp. coracana TaxID=191504 RepID=A0AAV5DLC8_ELECO|nr:hypothetical protein PR202_ga29974 [Eleusine coracana subsp. coracana]
MKYMKLGTKPDTFYTEEAVRSVVSEIPADLIIQVNNTKYQLHKFPLLLKCGLLQRLCSDTEDGEEEEPVPVALHDIPGGEASFELCAKFCYGISISISASILVPAMLAARFLRMTEAVAKGNLVARLETFFDTCVLQGWKDSVAALQAAWRVSGWTESRVVQPCIDSIVEKILAPPSKVTWSYTYTRPGYTRRAHQSVPKDWWTEDVSELDLEVFRSVLSTVRASRLLPPPLIGEALHVYACKHLVDPLRAAGSAFSNGGVSHQHHQAQSSSAAAGDQEDTETVAKQRRVLESIVTMIPGEPGSVTGRFLLRLLRVANFVGASPSTRAQLVRQAGAQLDEARAVDLLIPMPSDPHAYDVGAAEAEHPDLSKADKKRLCRLIDCRKLSPEARARAISNDRMPLRTIVQLLFVEQERTMAAAASASASHGGAVSRLAARTKDDEPSFADHKSDVHRPRADRGLMVADGGAAMARSLSASTKTPARKDRAPENRGSRMRNKQ